MQSLGKGVREIGIATRCSRSFGNAGVGNTVKLTFFSNSRIGGGVDGGVDGAITKDNDGATKGVKERLSALLKGIVTQEGNRAPEYITALGVSNRTLERYLQQLKETGLIEFRGEASQTGGYYLTNEMRAKLKGK